MLLRPCAVLVAHENGEFIRVVLAVDQIFVRCVRIVAGLRVDGKHAVLGFDSGIRFAHARVALKGLLQVIDVGAVRVTDMVFGNAVGQFGVKVHVRSLGVACEGALGFVYFDLGFFSYRLPVICRLLNDRDAVIVAV